MALDKTHRLQLRDQIVFLEVLDACEAHMDARRYFHAARALRKTVARDLGDLPMQAFVSDTLPTLQTMAENVYFDGHGRFADLDGSGLVWQAQALCDDLLQRLQQH